MEGTLDGDTCLEGRAGNIIEPLQMASETSLLPNENVFVAETDKWLKEKNSIMLWNFTFLNITPKKQSGQFLLC